MGSNIGRMIYGYCEGRFGRDSYGDKRIEAEGYDWIVVREDDGTINCLSFKNGMEKQKCIDKWSIAIVTEE